MALESKNEELESTVSALSLETRNLKMLQS